MNTHPPNADFIDAVAVVERLILAESEDGDVERTSWADLLGVEPLKSAYQWLMARAEEIGVETGDAFWATTVMVHHWELDQILENPATPVEEIVHHDDDGPAYLRLLSLCEGRLERGEGGRELEHAAQRIRTAFRNELVRWLGDDALRAVGPPLELFSKLDVDLADEMWRQWRSEIELQVEEHRASERSALARAS